MKQFNARLEETIYFFGNDCEFSRLPRKRKILLMLEAFHCKIFDLSEIFLERDLDLPQLMSLYYSDQITKENIGTQVIDQLISSMAEDIDDLLQEKIEEQNLAFEANDSTYRLTADALVA